MVSSEIITRNNIEARYIYVLRLHGNFFFLYGANIDHSILHSERNG